MTPAEIAAAQVSTCHGCGARSDDTDDSVGDLVPCEWCEPTRMLCDDCVHTFDEEAEHGTTLNGCGECASRSKARELRSALRSALPWLVAHCPADAAALTLSRAALADTDTNEWTER